MGHMVRKLRWRTATFIELLGEEQPRSWPMKRLFVVFNVEYESGGSVADGLVMAMGPAVAEDEDFGYSAADMEAWLQTNYSEGNKPHGANSPYTPVVPCAWAGSGLVYFREGELEMRPLCVSEQTDQLSVEPFRLEILAEPILDYLASFCQEKEGDPVRLKISWEGSLPMEYREITAPSR